MNKIDSELVLLHNRIAILEQQKRMEQEKLSNPMKSLEEIIEHKKKAIENNRYSKAVPLARLYDQEKVDMLEPILLILKNIQERLDALENKK